MTDLHSMRMTRLGFPFNHVQLSRAQLLATRTTYTHIHVPLSQTRVTGFSKFGAFTPKILSTIQPTTILEGQCWENYRRVSSSSFEEPRSSVVRSQHEERHPHNEERSSSSRLESSELFAGRNNNHADNLMSYFGNNSSLSSFSSSGSEDSLSRTDLNTNGEFVVRSSAMDMRILERLRNAPVMPVLPPPYPYPEDPPPTYEEAMCSVTHMNIEGAEEVAVTLAELDGVLSQYTADHPEEPAQWVQGSCSPSESSEEGVHLQLQSFAEDSENLFNASESEVSSCHSATCVSQGVQTEEIGLLGGSSLDHVNPNPPVSNCFTLNSEFEVLY